MKKGRIVGIGGIMFRSDDPVKTREWYQNYLGLHSESYGAVFNWRNYENPEKEGTTAWCVMPHHSEYFGENLNQQFMVNYIVENLTELLFDLEEKGICQVKPRENSEFGNFAWILDNNGQQIELWEPVSE